MVPVRCGEERWTQGEQGLHSLESGSEAWSKRKLIFKIDIQGKEEEVWWSWRLLKTNKAQMHSLLLNPTKTHFPVQKVGFQLLLEWNFKLTSLAFQL